MAEITKGDKVKNQKTYHGVIVRDNKTKEIVEFISCKGKEALQVLSGIRMQMSNRYNAVEGIISNKEYKEFKGKSQ